MTPPADRHALELREAEARYDSLANENVRLRAALDDPAYQYAGSRIPRTAIEARNTEISGLLSVLDLVKRERDMQKNQIQRLRNTLAAIEADLKPYAMELGAKIRENSALRVELEVLRGERDKAGQELIRRDADARALKARVEELEARLRNVKNWILAA